MKTKIITLVVAILVVLLVALPAAGQLEGITNFNGVHMAQSSFATATPQLLIQNGGAGVSVEVRDANATPVWSVDSAGGVTQTGDTTLSGLINLSPAAYTLTGAQTLTPTVSYYELAPAAVLTLTLGTGSAGDWLIIANTVTTSTVIVDTGATAGGGNITLGENDIAEFINIDGTWAEIASPDNS